MSDISEELPEHGHEDPDDDDFEPRNSSPEDFLDPIEEGS